MNTIHSWLERARWIALPQSLMPALTALALAAGQAGFRIGLGLLAVWGACMAHLSLNLFDDYFDYQSHQSGYRETLVRAGVRARTGKCAYLTGGAVKPRQLLLACWGFGLLAVLPGAVIFLVRGWPVAALAGLAAALGLSYSGKPLRLSYRGLGEPVIGLMFGPLLISGVYYAACGRLDPPVLLAGPAIGLLVLNVLYTHSVLDLEADLSVGKRTLAALIPTGGGRLLACGGFSLGPYLLAGCGIGTGLLPAAYGLVFLSLPLALALLRSMGQFLREKGGAVQRRPWYGPMAHWADICTAGLDWFLLRWLLARNLMAAFALLWAVSPVL